MQVQHDGGALAAGGGERPPAERGEQVVGVDDAGAAPPDLGGHLAGVEPAPCQARRGCDAAEPARIAREQLGALSELVADEREQALDDPLLATGGAVAVVQEEDHRGAKPRLSGRSWSRRPRL